jgi:carbamate kinase
MHKQGRSERVLVAVGGNAIVPNDRSGETPRPAVEKAMDQVADLLEDGHEIILTHGNGPQVGHLLRQSEVRPHHLPRTSLDICVAYTQASIGLAMTAALEKALRRRGSHRPVATLITRVSVSEEDPAWSSPSKPIGPPLDAGGHKAVVEAGGDTIALSADRWRRVVPSPDPLEVVDEAGVRALISAGIVPIVAGGGGVAGLFDASGWRGVEAVLDKDLTAAHLGAELNADCLVIATDVPHVMVGYGEPEAHSLHKVTAAELRELASMGHFPPGSMGPKVEAALRFVEAGGKRSIITSIERIREGVAGRAGTIVETGERAA